MKVLSTAVLVFAYVQIVPQATGQSPRGEEPPEIAAMSAAIDRWLEETEFACKYTKRQGRAATLADAEQGIFQVTTGETSGVFNKANGRLRCSIDTKEEIRVVSKTRDGGTYANVDVDEVAADQGVWLYCIPQLTPEDQHGIANFRPRDPPDGAEHLRLGRFDPGIRTRRGLSPISIDGNVIGSYLTEPTDLSRLTNRELIESTNDRIVIRVNYTSGAFKCHKDVAFSLAYSCPVVTEIRKHMDNGNGTASTSTKVASDFVEVPGGPLPRSIRSITTNTKNGEPRHPEAPYFVSIWRSEDLGSRPVTDEDFLVPIKPTTRIDGLANPQAAMTDGKLDISKVKLSDLNIVYAEDQNAALAAVELNAAQSGRAHRNLWFVLTGAVAIVLAAVLFFRGRTSRIGR